MSLHDFSWFSIFFQLWAIKFIEKTNGKINEAKKKTIGFNTCGDAQHQKKKNNKLNQLFRPIDHVIYLCKDYIIDTI